jgi:hypothetical protein
VAIYVFKMKTFSRNAGRRGSRSTSAAAYRAGERIRDEQTGAVYDHHRRQDVLHRQIILPQQLAAGPKLPGWAASRTTLWNAAEKAETRRNARVAREFTLALPHELSAADRLRLAQRFAHEVSDRYHIAVDLVLHAPRHDPRNYHAHLLATTREVSEAGLGRKAELELSGTERHRRGLARWRQEREMLRERWAEHTNEALREANLSIRVSHRPTQTRGLSRRPHLPLMAWYMEKEGRHSIIAERIRARHRAALEQAQTLQGPVRELPLSPARARERSMTLPEDRAPTGWMQRLHEQTRSAWRTLQQRLGLSPQHTTKTQEFPPTSSPSQPSRSVEPELQPLKLTPQPEQHRTRPGHSRSFDSIQAAQRKAFKNWLALREGRVKPEHAPNPSLQRDRPLEQDRDHGLDLDF